MHYADVPEFMVFPGARGGRMSDATLLAVLRRMKVPNTVHGFRSSFRTWLAEETNFPREVAEAALAHQNPNEVERSYQRGNLLDKRRKVMDAWGAYCARGGQGRSFYRNSNTRLMMQAPFLLPPYWNVGEHQRHTTIDHSRKLSAKDMMPEEHQAALDFSRNRRLYLSYPAPPTGQPADSIAAEPVQGVDTELAGGARAEPDRHPASGFGPAF